ncbi:hypothetical protein [Streptacidiphilus albus]|uniref:hypothetical protein n=1 Tax=Streptacidiphilus albus TaxID=105425 RepID=UPI000AED0ABB|nr:hypothetical protein [Streptacidiphilus albus]
MSPSTAELADSQRLRPDRDSSRPVVAVTLLAGSRRRWTTRLGRSAEQPPSPTDAD